MKTTLQHQFAPISISRLPVLLAGVLLTGLQPLGAAVIPYMNDFSGTGDNTAFPSENTNAEWNVSSGSYVFNYTNTTITPSTASLSITNAAATSFTMETQFTVTSNMLNVNSNGATIGFGLFGASTTFAGSGSATSYYLADFSVANSTGSPGTIRILSLGESAGFSASNGAADANVGSSALAIVQNTTYTLRLDGVYSGTTLTMTLGLYDAAGTTQIGTSATASDTSPLTGTNFGYRNRVGIGTGAFTVNFDNFSVVPEPGVAGLLVLGGAMVLSGRRRVRSCRN